MQIMLISNSLINPTTAIIFADYLASGKLGESDAQFIQTMATACETSQSTFDSDNGLA